MRIAVIGATGWLGGAIAHEALERHHTVTALGRDPERLGALEGMATATIDVRDPEALRAAIAGHDIVVSAVTDRTDPARAAIPASAEALIAAVPAAGVPRLAVVGGGGSLLAPDGDPFVDHANFPAAYRAEALAQQKALLLLRAAPAELDWTYLSPPPENLQPGEKRGGYLVRGDDKPVTDAHGESGISSGDFASAMLDELERPQFSRKRFTAGYA